MHSDEKVELVASFHCPETTSEAGTERRAVPTTKWEMFVADGASTAVAIASSPTQM